MTDESNITGFSELNGNTAITENGRVVVIYDNLVDYPTKLADGRIIYSNTRLANNPFIREQVANAFIALEARGSVPYEE